MSCHRTTEPNYKTRELAYRGVSHGTSRHLIVRKNKMTLNQRQKNDKADFQLKTPEESLKSCR